MDRDCISKDEARRIESQLDEILSEVKKIHGAFPRTGDGEVDFSGHREAHEAMIEAAKAQTEFWRELKLDVIKKGVWGLLIIICGLAITGFATKLGIAEINHTILK